MYAQMSAFMHKFISTDDRLKDYFSSPSEIMRLFCVFSCNNFNISDDEMNYIGIGLYPTAAMINHS